MPEKLGERAALILIDIQQGFEHEKWGQRNNPEAELVAAEILNAFRQSKRPIFHIQHCSLEADSPLRADLPGCRFKELVIPVAGEPVFKKNVNSAFIGTDLENELRAASINELVIVGLTTDHCVSTSTRMAGNLGFKTYLVSDAVATFAKTGPDGRHWSAEDLHSAHLASLDREFASVLKGNEIMDLL